MWSSFPDTIDDDDRLRRSSSTSHLSDNLGQKKALAKRQQKPHFWGVDWKIFVPEDFDAV